MKIEEILAKSLKFEGANQNERFSKIFSSLYAIDLYKDGLDLILTKSQEEILTFEVKIKKGWDTNVGCYLTQQSKIYNKLLKTFTHKFDHKIILRSLEINVMAHEMAHCLEVESELELTKDFRQAIHFDMAREENGKKYRRCPKNLALKGEIERLMVNALRSYPPHQHISELFARYFELLSISRDVKPNGDFTTAEVMGFFANSTKWIEQIFNTKIKAKINSEIAKQTENLLKAGKFKAEKKFADNDKSFYKRVDSSGQKSFSGNVRSNASWHSSWQKHQELENQKDKNN